MSKFKQALMISVMVFLGAFVILSLVKDQMRQERQIQHYRQLDSLLESTGLDYIEDFNPFTETTDMRIGLYADEEGYGIVTACLAPEEITGGEVLRSAMYPVDTGDETVQAWYGICGTEASPSFCSCWMRTIPAVGTWIWWETELLVRWIRRERCRKSSPISADFRTMGTRSR